MENVIFNTQKPMQDSSWIANDLLFTVDEASKILKTDKATVRRLIDKGFLRALKLGRIKVRRLELERFAKWAEGKDLTDLDNVIDLENY